MLKKILGAGVTSFIGVSAIALPMHFGVRAEDAFMLIGPMGASAALVFGAPEAPFAQPRNVVFGQMICAAIGTVSQCVVRGVVAWRWNSACHTLQREGCGHAAVGVPAQRPT